MKKTNISRRRISIRKLRVSAKKKEHTRLKLVKVAKNLAVTAKEKEDIRLATLNLLEDLSVEKDAVENARVKEEAIILSIGDGLISTDENEKIVLINKTAATLLNQTISDLKGKIFSEVIPIQDEKGTTLLHQRPISLALSAGKTTTTTTGSNYYYVRKDGTKFPVAFTVTPVKLAGKVIGAIEIFRDITREKEVDKAKTEFVSLASHQLRTPLTTVSWYSEMILTGDIGSVTPEQKKYLEEIYKGNQRMIELVNTLLNVSRIELGTFLMSAKPTDVVALARSVLIDQKLKISSKNLKITTKFEPNIPKILIDPGQLGIILQNLVANAVTYTPSGAKIDISISLAEPKRVLIKVSDTGYGIPQNQQDNIFTKFFRADNAREKDTEGTGLGLYIVKSIVENSDGKIWFDSKENKGSTFYVSLPLAGKAKK